MSSCCLVSANQIGTDAASVCMECSTVTTPFMSFSPEVMVLSAVITAAAYMFGKIIKKMSFFRFSKNIVKA